jgi:hypothetical protein
MSQHYDPGLLSSVSYLVYWKGRFTLHGRMDEMDEMVFIVSYCSQSLNGHLGTHANAIGLGFYFSLILYGRHVLLGKLLLLHQSLLGHQQTS